MSEQTSDTRTPLHFMINSVGKDLSIRAGGPGQILVNGEPYQPALEQERIIALRDFSWDLDLIVPPDSTIVIKKVGADTRVQGIEGIEIEKVGSDLELENIGTATIGSVGSDLLVQGISSALHLGKAGNDCIIRGSADAELRLGKITNDLEIEGAARVSIGTVGNDCDIERVQGHLEIASVGNDGTIEGVGDGLKIASIGNDAVLTKISGAINVGSVGEDLNLQSTFIPGSYSRIYVGNDAVLHLPENTSLALEARVGGDISGASISQDSNGKIVNILYGEGESHCVIYAGGDLIVHGASDVRSNVSGGWQDFGFEMANLGREIGRMGEELARDFTTTFAESGWKWGADWSHDLSQRLQKEARKMQRRVEKEARQAEKQTRWVEKEAKDVEKRARRYASDRLEKAVSALSNTPTQKESPRRDPAHLQKDRRSILQMIAEGRLSPEEGDQLLEALER